MGLHLISVSDFSFTLGTTKQPTNIRKLFSPFFKIAQTWDIFFTIFVGVFHSYKKSVSTIKPDTPFKQIWKSPTASIHHN